MSFKTSLYGIQNERGAVIDLNYDCPVQFINPSGLGVSSELGFANLSSGFFYNTQEEPRQLPLTGDLRFTQDAFENYGELVNFLLRAESLVFYYQPMETRYYKRVKLEQLEKSTRNGMGVMTAKVTFQPLTPWYTANDVVINVTHPEDMPGFNSARFNVDTFSGNEASGYFAVVQSVGHFPAAFTALFTGFAEYPVLTVTGEDSGTEYGRMALDYALQGSGVIEISTAPDDAFVRVNGTDAIQYVDISSNPFPSIPTSERCAIRLTAPNILSGTLKISVRNYYRSV